MLKDITIGQYYPRDTILHRLDPRVKLLGTIVYIVCVFLFQGVIGLCLLAGILIVLILLSQVPVKRYLKGIRAIWVLLVITAIFNLLLTREGAVLWQYGILTITARGLHHAVFYSIRLILLVIGASVMTLTTSPNKLTDGMEEGLKPLQKVGVPIHEIAMMMSIALRFIPILGDEAEKIKRAQIARGADFEEGGLIRRVKGLIPLLVPLFVSAFSRAEDLSLAMEARCYHGGAGRTKLHPLHYAGRDYMAYLCVAAFLVAVSVLRFLDLALPVYSYANLYHQRSFHFL